MGNSPSNMKTTKIYRASNGNLYYKRQRTRSHKEEDDTFSVVVAGKRRKCYKDADGTIWFRDSNKCWYPYKPREMVVQERGRRQSCYVDDLRRPCSPDSYARLSFDRSSSVDPLQRYSYVDRPVVPSCYVDDLGRPCSEDSYSRGSFERIRTPSIEEHRRSYYVNAPSEPYSRRFDDDKVSVRIINVDKF